ncbi:hypothetical protein ACT3OH_16005 [Vreelandella zhanjiangensis]|uniref:hypothetical protein n=1 Tax=Vreelandella zhanjiangensis TaxID=1121960 RepID=UPI00402AA006
MKIDKEKVKFLLWTTGIPLLVMTCIYIFIVYESMYWYSHDIFLLRLKEDWGWLLGSYVLVFLVHLFFILKGRYYIYKRSTNVLSRVRYFIKPTWRFNIPVLTKKMRFRALHISSEFNLNGLNEVDKDALKAGLKEQVVNKVVEFSNGSVDEIVLASHILNRKIAKGMIRNIEERLPLGWKVEFEDRKTPWRDKAGIKYYYFYMYFYLPKILPLGGKIVIKRSPVDECA